MRQTTFRKVNWERSRMSVEASADHLIPLPPFPSGASDALSTGTVGFRRYGVTESDLAVDFAMLNRAALATHLLELCTVDPQRLLPSDIFNELSIGKRIVCLLVLAAGGQDKVLSLVLTCQDCSQELELELMLSEVLELQGEADRIETVSVDLGGKQVEFRKPKGRDQEIWGGVQFRDERDVVVGMIGTLAMTPDFTPFIDQASVNAVEEAFDEADPLVDFRCRVSCGECGRLTEYTVDLMETALGMLNQTQNQLIYTIHRLASHYHWSERDIFAVPEWRRQKYVQLVGASRT